MKKHCNALLFVLLLVLCGALPCMGQMGSDSISNDRYVLYYICDEIEIEEDYLDNAYQIFRIKDILARSPQIDSITIYAYASPEGPLLRNKWLSEQRAIAAREFILKNLPDSSVLRYEDIHLRPMGENWEGLETELEANYHLPNRDRVMKILHAPISTDKKKWRLKNLDNGYTYNYIIRNHMPRLRLATWICMYISPDRPLGPKFEKVDEFNIPLSDKRIDVTAPLPEYRERKTILALKSNLLYDALTLVNYSIEVPITKNFSALYYHQFPWWRWGESNNEYCIRFLSIGAEARWWFKPMTGNKNRYNRDKLVGHFLGVYAESGKWDFEWERRFCHQGEHWSAGLSYGYSMPVGKYFNLEYSLSLGYASIPYRKFSPSGDYQILWRDPVKHGRWHYFGPTKAQISLVYPITITTKRKGGAR